jgi:hypothetical protein
MTFSIVACAVSGALLAGLVLWDAFETVLVPRRIGRRLRLTNLFYLFAWRGWRAVCRRVRVPSRREAWLGTFAPLSILLLLVCWALGLIVAFALLQFAAGSLPGVAGGRAPGLLYMSGETFFTLGFGDLTPMSGPGRMLAVLEAGMGFGFLGTVIGYLPTMYAAFSQREVGIALLDARAGSPPTAAELLRRTPATGGAARADGTLADMERWSAVLLETHISYPLLAYYRSQHSNQSWLAALTATLDACAAVIAGAEGLNREQAKTTFAMGRHALVDVAQSFVTRPAPGMRERLPQGELARLRALLAESGVRLPATPEFESRLATVRRSYEPYAWALAQHLLLELPPWIHAERRRDNWRGGPWDRELGVRGADLLNAEEHF